MIDRLMTHVRAAVDAEMQKAGMAPEEPPPPAPGPTPAHPAGAPDYAKWDALLRTAADRPQAEKIARATGIAVRPEAAPAAAPVDPAALGARLKAAQADPAQFDALARDLAEPDVSRDDVTALAKQLGPDVHAKARKLPKAKQIELLRQHLTAGPQPVPAVPKELAPDNRPAPKPAPEVEKAAVKPANLGTNASRLYDVIAELHRGGHRDASGAVSVPALRDEMTKRFGTSDADFDEAFRELRVSRGVSTWGWTAYNGLTPKPPADSHRAVKQVGESFLYVAPPPGHDEFAPPADGEPAPDAGPSAPRPALPKPPVPVFPKELPDDAKRPPKPAPQKPPVPTGRADEPGYDTRPLPEAPRASCSTPGRSRRAPSTSGPRRTWPSTPGAGCRGPTSPRCRPARPWPSTSTRSRRWTGTSGAWGWTRTTSGNWPTTSRRRSTT
jgi:hypothetical protein